MIQCGVKFVFLQKHYDTSQQFKTINHSNRTKNLKTDRKIGSLLKGRTSLAVLALTGNYGKALGVGRSKKSQSREELRRSREELRRSREDLTEEAQGLLESEEELDREEVLSPEPENRSVCAAMRPQPTEYDR